MTDDRQRQCIAFLESWSSPAHSDDEEDSELTESSSGSPLERLIDDQQAPTTTADDHPSSAYYSPQEDEASCDDTSRPNCQDGNAALAERALGSQSEESSQNECRSQGSLLGQPCSPEFCVSQDPYQAQEKHFPVGVGSPTLSCSQDAPQGASLLDAEASLSEEGKAAFSHHMAKQSSSKQSSPTHSSSELPPAITQDGQSPEIRTKQTDTSQLQNSPSLMSGAGRSGCEKSRSGPRQQTLTKFGIIPKSSFPADFPMQGFLGGQTQAPLKIELKIREPEPRKAIKLVDIPPCSVLTKGEEKSQREGKLSRHEEGWNQSDVTIPSHIPPGVEKIVVLESEKEIHLEGGETYRLYDHQVIGWKWLLNCFDNGSGGILADDQGLGKTIQTAILLRHLYGAARIKRVLLLCPVSVLHQWEEHLTLLCPGVPIHLFHGPKHKERFESFRLLNRKYILITTFETFRRSAETAVSCISTSGAVKKWDIWIADEATAMKNHRKALWAAASKIAARCRFLLTGTPVMNRYDELWALVSLVRPHILGDYADFSRNYACLLDRKHLSNHETRERLVRQLRDTILPFILRRTKEETFAKLEPAAAAQLNDSSISTEATSNEPPLTLPPKVEILVWQDLTTLQRDVYELALRRINYRDRSQVLTSISYLKKLCRHPVLCLRPEEQTWRRAQSFPSPSLEEDNPPVDFTFTPPDAPLTPIASPRNVTFEEACELDEIRTRVDQSSPESLRSACAKLGALYNLIPHLVANDHSILIFSESTATLDLIELAVLKEWEATFEYRRLDGSCSSKARQRSIWDFENDPQVKIMLLSTGAGGFGLNLTQADRVILMDPSWNPAKDRQAIDRAHRIGQKRPVMVYRFITGGAIEDNMLRIQMFKLNLSSSLLQGASHRMWFTDKELRDLFSISSCRTSKTRQLVERLTENENSLLSSLEMELGSDSPLQTLMAEALASMDDVLKEIEDVKVRQQQQQVGKR